jgi:hypothetical protein
MVPMRKVILFLLTLLLLVILPTSIYAKEVRTKSTISGDTVIIEKDEVIDRDFFAGGEILKVFGTINGDLYAAGGTVVIDGVINGDLLVAGGTVTISGHVTDDVRAAGGQININGEVGRNLTVAGGNIDIGSNAKLVGSVVIAGGNVNIDAPIVGNLNAGVGNLILSSTVGGDIEAGLGTATLTKNAQVGGDFIYWSEEDASIAEGASISGIVTRNDPSSWSEKDIEVTKQQVGQFRKFFGGTAVVYSIITTLITGLLLLRFFPKFSLKVTETLSQRTWASLGWGFLTLVGFPVLFVVGLLTIVGIPTALILLAFYMIYIYISKMFVLLWAGNYLSSKIDRKMSSYGLFILGLVAYTVIGLIPYVGRFVGPFTLLFGLGALVLTCRATYNNALKKGIL